MLLACVRDASWVRNELERCSRKKDDKSRPSVLHPRLYWYRTVQPKGGLVDLFNLKILNRMYYVIAKSHHSFQNCQQKHIIIISLLRDHSRDLQFFVLRLGNSLIEGRQYVKIKHLKLMDLDEKFQQHLVKQLMDDKDLHLADFVGKTETCSQLPCHFLSGNLS